MVATQDLDQAAEHFDRIMLLNRSLIGFGAADVVLQTDKLLQAYSGRVHSLDGETILAADDCCGDENEHDNHH